MSPKLVPGAKKLFTVTLPWSGSSDLGDQGTYASSVWAEDEDQAILAVATEMADYPEGQGGVPESRPEARRSFIEGCVENVIECLDVSDVTQGHLRELMKGEDGLGCSLGEVLQLMDLEDSEDIVREAALLAVYRSVHRLFRESLAGGALDAGAISGLLDQADALSGGKSSVVFPEAALFRTGEVLMSDGSFLVPGDVWSWGAKPEPAVSPDEVAELEATSILWRSVFHKLYFSRRHKGRSGFMSASAEHLSRLLRESVDKGDPTDVACYAAMLLHGKHSIAAAEAEAPAAEERPRLSSILAGHTLGAAPAVQQGQPADSAEGAAE